MGVRSHSSWMLILSIYFRILADRILSMFLSCEEVGLQIIPGLGSEPCRKRWNGVAIDNTNKIR
jgi:hypothetical protein